jgi:class 3 adenylate cyclase/tetratricopeptide (TPR) repeat protein
MFTDIVGSTDMKGKMPGATPGARQEAFREKVKNPHDAIIIERVTGQDGCIVKGTGDGFFIAFADVGKAVLCAVEIQERIGEASIFTPDGTLQIRIGLNSGQADPVANDYTASAADKAARVESKAQPGRVYLSRETHELIRGKVNGISTASAGSHVLKGVANEELFVAFREGSGAGVSVPAVPSAGPAPSTTIPHNLPSLQPFFGREDELQKIAVALDPESRGWGALIDGLGGIGKTSLAVRAAYDASPEDFHHIVFVSLQSRELDDNGVRDLSGFLISGLAELFGELAHELGRDDIVKAPEDQRPRLLLDALRGTQTLLVLDNLESLIKAERDTLFTFVKRLPAGCKAILTARGRIGSGAEELILEKLSEDAALATLAELATRNPHLAKTSEPERLVLYRETGGKPLLLRWTAGQIGRGSCLTFSEAIGYLRSCPAGNDPLEFIFGDLVEGFSETETKTLCALSYFSLPAKGRDIAVIAGFGETDVEAALHSLTNRSLANPDADLQTFALVPLVAEFLRRKRPEIVNNVGIHLMDRADWIIAKNGWQKNELFSELESQWMTIVPALRLFVSGSSARLQRVCAALSRYLYSSGRWDELLSLFKDAEKLALDAQDYKEAGWRAYQRGYIHFQRREEDKLRDCIARVTDYWGRPETHLREKAAGRRLQGLLHRLRGEWAEAISAFTCALEKDRRVMPMSRDVQKDLANLSRVEIEGGRKSEGEGHLREANEAAQAVEAETGNTNNASEDAAFALANGDWSDAEAKARDALRRAEGINRLDLVADNCLRIAQAMLKQGRGAEALPHAKRAVEFYIRSGSADLEIARSVLWECEEGLGGVGK